MIENGPKNVACMILLFVSTPQVLQGSWVQITFKLEFFKISFHNCTLSCVHDCDYLHLSLSFMNLHLVSHIVHSNKQNHWSGVLLKSCMLLIGQCADKHNLFYSF